MNSARKTKKEIKKHPTGVLWANHAKYWLTRSLEPDAEYPGISEFFFDVDIFALSEMTGLSEASLRKYITAIL